MPEVLFRSARRADLPFLITLLADDILGSAREQPREPLEASYTEAFAAIDDSNDHELVVAECAGEIVGCLQISYLPGLSHRGSWRAQLEGVRVASHSRGSGVGKALIADALRRAEGRGCRIVQLTTDLRRPDARRFYESLGFVTSHAGLKRQLVGRLSEPPESR